MKEPVTNRRAFLESAARTALLGGLGGLAALVIARRQVCTNSGVCKSCNVYAKCELPQREKQP
jgi:hypothetical protein